MEFFWVLLGEIKLRIESVEVVHFLFVCLIICCNKTSRKCQLLNIQLSQINFLKLSLKALLELRPTIDCILLTVLRQTVKVLHFVSIISKILVTHTATATKTTSCFLTCTVPLGSEAEGIAAGALVFTSLLKVAIVSEKPWAPKY